MCQQLQRKFVELTAEHEKLKNNYTIMVQQNEELFGKKDDFDQAIGTRAEMLVSIDDLELRLDR